LTITGGFPDTWAGGGATLDANSDWVKATLTGAHSPAGEEFAYSDPGVNLIPAILRRTTRQSVQRQPIHEGRIRMADRPTGQPSRVQPPEAAPTRHGCPRSTLPRRSTPGRPDQPVQINLF
jgi:hypothetical protein